MSAYLFFDWRARPLSISGDIMPGAVLKFFITQTTTPASVYSDASLSTPLGTEVTADEDGHFPAIYMDGAVTYRAQLYDADGVLQPDGDVDPLAPPRDHKPGEVVWFHGTEEERDEAFPPTLYQVLDGTNGTPDGRDRVPIMAGGTYESGDTGGDASATTSAAGGHDHTGKTSETVLDENHMPVHGHRAFVRLSNTQRGNTRGFGFSSTAGFEGQVIDDAPYGYLEDSPSESVPLIEPTGTADPEGHDHDIEEEADHDHTVDTLPPYVALWALMRRRD